MGNCRRRRPSRGRVRHITQPWLETGELVLDFDTRTFFDSLDHEWLVRMLEHRIADRRIIRLIRRWLKAGVLEGGEWTAVDTGSPQQLSWMSRVYWAP